MGSVLGNQAGTLLGGGTNTVTDELARLNEAFLAAGMEKVQLEMQHQLDAFLK